MKHFLAAAVTVAAILLLGPGRVQAQAERPFPAQTTSIPCPIDVPATVETTCGALIVPENYAEPDGARVRLPYIILHSPHPNPAPDPLVYTLGGPGYSSLVAVWGFVDSPLLAARDVIIFEQRGNRYAEPALVCDVAAQESAPGQTLCLDAFQAQGIDIAQYTVQNIVRDLLALRRALGYAQWNLYGGSFSTSLMLLAMEAEPEGVRSAILESVNPPHESIFAHEADSALRAIRQMFADCQADSRCAAAYPDLEAQFFALIRQLNAAPVTVEVRRAAADTPMPVEIDGDLFIDWVVLHHFYQHAFPPYGAAYLPLLISEMSRGNLAPLESLAQSYWGDMLGNPNWAWGLYFAINCQQDLPATGSRPAVDLAADAALDGFAKNAALRDVCAAWDLPAQPPAATAFVQSDVPALVLAGAYDPVTPPDWSRATAEHLPHSAYVEFAGYGHDVTLDNPCATALQAAFLADPHAPLDTSCVRAASGPDFVLHEALYIAPGLANSGYDISLGDPKGVAWIETLAVISLVGMAISLLILLGVGVAWLVRRWGLEKTAVAAYVLCLLLIAAAFAIPLLTTRINQAYFERDVMLYALGPPRDFAPATLLAWIAPLAGLLILALAALTLWAWLARRWRRSFRLVTTLVVSASLLIVVLGVRWGLFTMLL
jgi:pimeloyl-ACP methyl ester carboxylesterase